MPRPLSPRSTLAALLTALIVPLCAPGDVAAWIPENSPAPASSRFT